MKLQLLKRNLIFFVNLCSAKMNQIYLQATSTSGAHGNEMKAQHTKDFILNVYVEL